MLNSFTSLAASLKISILDLIAVGVNQSKALKWEINKIPIIIPCPFSQLCLSRLIEKISNSQHISSSASWEARAGVRIVFSTYVMSNVLPEILLAWVPSSQTTLKNKL